RLSAVPESVEEIGLPLIAACQMGLIGRDILEVGHTLARIEHRVELATHRLPLGLELPYPGELRGVVQRAVSERGMLCELPPKLVQQSSTKAHRLTLGRVPSNGLGRLHRASFGLRSEKRATSVPVSAQRLARSRAYGVTP